MSFTTIDLRDGHAPRMAEVRHIDPWSVARVSMLFYLALLGVLLVAASVLWFAAAVTGVVGNVERFLGDAGFDDFRFLPGQLFAAFMVGGLVLVVAGTVTNLLLATLYNVVVDTVGGIRVSLDSEKVVERPTANLTAPLPTVRGYSSVG